MATIIVEDGTGKANSNSYISEADFATYATDRGVTVSGTASELLVVAMDYIEQQPFQGIKGTRDQALQWPRDGVYIDGYDFPSDEIPQLLKDALCEAAIAIDGGDNPLANEEQQVKREKIDVLEVEYMDGSRVSPYLKAVEYKLKKLLRSSGRGISAIAMRG